VKDENQKEKHPSIRRRSSLFNRWVGCESLSHCGKTESSIKRIHPIGNLTPSLAASFLKSAEEAEYIALRLSLLDESIGEGRSGLTGN
jgi:hypothetical protein